jgi:hypothetical protein
MAITPQGLLVPGPQARPSRYGLFSVAQMGGTTDPHWQAGVQYDDALCGDVSSTLPHCGDGSPEPAAKETDPGPLSRYVDPFTLIGSYDCSTGGRRSQDAFDIARARLFAREEQGAERVFWTGVTVDGAISSSLATGDDEVAVTDVTGAGGALDPVTALGALEDAMGACVPGQGVIHVPLRAASALASQNLVVRDGDGMFTHDGQPAIFGAGYPGTGPDNVAVADGEAWLFGTGQVMVWRGEPFLTPPNLAEAVDRTLNDVTVFAERTYAVGFSCCLFAVRMVLSCCLGGS